MTGARFGNIFRIMKRVLLVAGCVAIFVSSAGCSFFLHPKAKIGKNRILPSYSGPKAHIAVADFEIKATKMTPEIASGLREMLVKALTDTSRFSIVERQESNPGAQGKSRPADLIINVSVAEFEPQSSGGRAGMGGGGSQASGAMGGLLGAGLNKAHIILDVRISDASNLETLSKEMIRGQATDATAGFMSGIFGDSNFGKGLAVYADSPMEKAMRICIVEGARFIVESVPANYYKH